MRATLLHLAIVAALVSQHAAAPEAQVAEDWVLLGSKLHGGFGSFIALGVHIGLDARAELKADGRTLDVTFSDGALAPCPCMVDGIQLSTGATPGRGTLHVESAKAPAGLFAVVTITDKTSGRTVRYSVPDALRTQLDAWNTLPPGQRLGALRAVPASQLFERVELPRR